MTFCQSLSILNRVRVTFLQTDALKRVPTGLYGPLKWAQDAIAVLLARLVHYPTPQGFSPSQRMDPQEPRPWGGGPIFVCKNAPHTFLNITHVNHVQSVL